MPTFIVAKTAAASGVAVPDGFGTLDFGQVGSGIIVRSEPQTASQGGHRLASWGDDVVKIKGSAFNDVMLGDADGQKLYGGAGHDRLQDGGDGAAASTLDGGAGNDRIYLAADGSRGYGGTGNDSFYITESTGVASYGGDGGDRYYVREIERLTVRSEAGNDVLSVNTGHMLRVNLGDGNDRAVLHAVDDAIVSGGNGNDSFSADGGSALRLSGSYGNDTFDVVDSDGVRISGGDGNDRIYLRDLDDAVVSGGNGDDLFKMGEGSRGHVLSAGAGTDAFVYWNTDGNTSDNVVIDLKKGEFLIDGTSGGTLTGFERLYTEDGDDKLVGSLDDNVLSAGGGNDRLFGDGGNDTIYGGTGDDTIVGGLGRDIIDGGAGNDVFQAGQDGDRFLFRNLHAGEVDGISILGKLDTLDYRGTADSLSDLTITINDDKSATIEVAAEGGVHTLVIERLLSFGTLTTELAEHVLVG